MAFVVANAGQPTGVAVLGFTRANQSAEPALFAAWLMWPDDDIATGGPARLGGIFPDGDAGADFYFQRWDDQANPPRGR